MSTKQQISGFDKTMVFNKFTNWNSAIMQNAFFAIDISYFTITYSCI